MESGESNENNHPRIVLLRLEGQFGLRCADSGKFNLKNGDYCYCSENGKEYFAQVKSETAPTEYNCTHMPIRKVTRKATQKDVSRAEKNEEKEQEAFGFCLERIEVRKLSMKLIKVKTDDEEHKMIFYYTADARVDFRELVKDLAAKFRTRIEMRQIGVRDEAKLLSGCGVCGRTFCCSTFLSNFAPISIRMAKVQNINLNPAKISGICGRLMCCLSYEVENNKDVNGDYDEKERK